MCALVQRDPELKTLYWKCSFSFLLSAREKRTCLEMKAVSCLVLGLLSCQLNESRQKIYIENINTELGGLSIINCFLH